jgi:hypothetical protein
MSAMVLIVCLFGMAMLIYLNQSSIIEPFYRTLNMTSGESPYKCGSCTKYGPTFDYKSQKSDRTYGVPNGCQKIF